MFKFEAFVTPQLKIELVFKSNRSFKNKTNAVEENRRDGQDFIMFCRLILRIQENKEPKIGFNHQGS